MAKLNADSLLNKLAELRDENGFSGSLAEVLKDASTSDDNSIINGKIEVDVADKISAKVEALVKSFEEQKEFNWRVHVLDPVSTIIDIVKMVGDFGDRQYIETLVVEIVKDLYKRYTPSIPYVPDFIAKWILNWLAGKLLPWVVDWVLDFVYGEDEPEEDN